MSASPRKKRPERTRRPSTALIRKTDSSRLSNAQVKSFPAEAAKINKLHDAVIRHANMALNKAIEIGGLLTTVKNKLEHGEWLPWLKANVPFHQTVASHYMRCFDQRGKLSNVLSLTEAYGLMAGKGQRPIRRESKQSDTEPAQPTENVISFTESETGSTATVLPEGEPDKVFGRTRDQIFSWFAQRVKSYFSVMGDREMIPAKVAVLKALLDDEELGGEPVLKYPDNTERSLREQLGGR
jgi:Protein of unknown function (DUF3102)